MFGGKETECWFTCVNVRITASRRNLKLILIYGLSQTPMMLATNLPVTSKEDVRRVVRTYFTRWRIEEYFRFRKQHFGFEEFRVRSLKAMNALNHYLILTSNQTVECIHSRKVIEETVCGLSERMVSHNLSTTSASVLNTSLRKPCSRSQAHICSIGFISGVAGGR